MDVETSNGYTTPTSVGETADTKEECVLCAQERSGHRRLPCGHEMCGACVRGIVRSYAYRPGRSLIAPRDERNGGTPCPYCRRAFTTSRATNAPDAADDHRHGALSCDDIDSDDEPCDADEARDQRWMTETLAAPNPSLDWLIAGLAHRPDGPTTCGSPTGPRSRSSGQRATGSA